MNNHRGLRVTGFVIHLLIGGLMIAAGSAKAFGLLPDEGREQLAPGIDSNLVLIGVGELITAVLLIVPRTLSIGVLLASAFWGGAICLHMSGGEAYAFQSVLLALTWLGAWLRLPALLCSFRPDRRPDAVPSGS